jgi:2-polyprenyl-3-methyl-5-hydroxy-6-metoxy-1,4-benzoquinol methylase
MSSDQPYIVQCPVGCGTDFDATDIEVPEGPLLRCRACGQLVSQITEAAYWASMQAFDHPDCNRPGEKESDRRMENATRRLTRLSELLGKPAAQVRLVDVGCSRGDFVDAAGRLGFDAEGVEPAPHTAAEGRAAGRKIHAGTLEQQRFPDASFDAVTLFEVIEHLREPITLLREIHRVVKPHGILLLSTGNGASWTARAMKQDWDYFQTRVDAGHISFFNPRSLALVAQRSGFSVAHLRTARVRLLEKGQVSGAVHAGAKLAAEALNLPARLLGKGHDMLVYLRREG